MTFCNHDSLQPTSVLQPVRTLLSELLLRPLFVRLTVLLRKHILPSRVRSLVHKVLRTVLPSNLSLRRRRQFCMLLHPIKRRMLNNIFEPILRHVRNLKKLGNSLDSSFKISFEIIKVNKEQVRLVTMLPPSMNMTPERPTKGT